MSLNVYRGMLTILGVIYLIVVNMVLPMNPVYLYLAASVFAMAVFGGLFFLSPKDREKHFSTYKGNWFSFVMFGGFIMWAILKLFVR